MSGVVQRGMSTCLLAAVIAAGAGVAQAAPDARPSAIEAGRQRAAGFDALNAGREAEAEAHFRAALDIAPNDPDVLGGLGVLKYRAGRLDEAHSLLGRAVTHGGAVKWGKALGEVAYYRDLKAAEAARDAGDLDRARRLAEPISRTAMDAPGYAKNLLLDLDRRKAVADGTRAAAAWKAGDLDGAARAFEAAVIAAPTDPWSRYRYARFLSWRGDKPAADRMAGPLAGRSDSDSLFAAALHENAERRGPAASALMDRIPAAARTPAMNDFALSLEVQFATDAARSLKQAGRGELARAGLSRLATRSDLPTEAMARLADGLFPVGEPQAALELARRAEAHPRGEAYEYQGVVSVLGRSGQGDAAAALIEDLAAMASEPEQQANVKELRARATLAKADWLSRKGDIPAALSLLKTQRAETPRDPEMLSALGWTSLAGGETQLSRAAFSDLAAERPEEAASWLGLAAASTRGRRFDDADAAIAQARRLAPDDPDVHLAAARNQQARGNLREALADLRKASDARTRLVQSDPFATLAPSVQAHVRPVFADLRAAPDPDDGRLRSEIAQVTKAAETRVEIAADHTSRTGDPGLSRLRTDRAIFAASTLAERGRVVLKVRLVEADAGRLNSATAPPGASARRRDQGAEILASYSLNALRAELGVTPLGFQLATVQGEAVWAGQIAPDLQAKAWAERRPVADSLVSYAGGRTSTGETWGQVMRTGGGVGLTLTRNKAGLYANASAFNYDGHHVRDNTAGKADLGVYADLKSSEAVKVQTGLNLHLEAFDHNENAYVLGRGGYFSPRWFAGVTSPLRVTIRRDGWDVEAMVSPGYQKYREDPVTPGAGRRTERGFGIEGAFKAEREIRPGVAIGGDIAVNTFGAYRETRIGLGIRARLGDPVR